MRPITIVASAAALALFALPATSQNQPGHVLDAVFISEGQGGFTGPFLQPGKFGESVCVIGDLDGDDVPDLAVGAPQTPSGPDLGVGAVWILFMEEDGSVREELQLDEAALPFALDAGDRFGNAVAPAGDLDDDGVLDLWVGAYGDDDGQTTQTFTGPGAVYLLSLAKTGDVVDHSKISDDDGSLGLGSNDAFGYSITVLGDLFGDGHDDLAVGAPFTPAGGVARGAFWLLDLAEGGKPKGALRLSDVEGNLQPTVTNSAYLGLSVSALGDLDGDGRIELAVGAPQEDVLATNDGAVWIYSLRGDGAVEALRRIDASLSVFGGDGPAFLHRFGRCVAPIGDIDADGHTDIAVGANTGGSNTHGALYTLMLSPDDPELVAAYTRVDDDEGFLPFTLDDFDNFGTSVSPLGDWDGDGTVDVVVGIPGYNDQGLTGDEGAVAMLFLRGPTFLNLGAGLPGSTTPKLSATGTLAAGGSFEVLVTEGPAFGSANLVLGFSSIHASFKGGLLVPAVDVLVPGIPLGAAGKVAISDVWPAGVPYGFESWLQAWFVDAGGPVGFSASNALKFIAGE